MKYIFPSALTVIFAALFLCSCDFKGSQEANAIDTTYTVNITMKGLDSGTLVIFFQDGDEWKSDSARNTNGKYVFKGKATEPKRASLQVKGDETYDNMTFYLENGTIEINAVKDSLSKAFPTGTQTNSDQMAFLKATESVRAKLDAFDDAYGKADKTNKTLIDSLDKSYELIDAEKMSVTREFIKAHPSSLVSVNEMREIYMYNANAKQFDADFQGLDSAIRSSSVGKKVEDFLAIVKKTDIDQIAPDFTLNDVNDKPVALSSLRGKYLLIDFWASWCGPCRRENPNLVKTYKKFNKRGFEVVGVSFDNPGNKDKWLEAIKKDQLTWLQLSDLKGWGSEAGKIYGIYAIPMNFLLDPQGKIIGKGLIGEGLSKKLEEVLE